MRVRRLEIGSVGKVKSLDWRHIAETSALAGGDEAGTSMVLARTIALHEIRRTS